jgi:hypothetical protein
VDDAFRVHRHQRAPNLDEDGKGLGHRQTYPFAQNVAQVAPLEKLHHVVVAPVGELTKREDVDQPRVLDVVHGARFQYEAADGVLVLGQPGRQHLDGDLLADDGVDGAVDRAHAALADARQDLVLAHLRARRELRAEGSVRRVKGT